MLPTVANLKRAAVVVGIATSNCPLFVSPPPCAARMWRNTVVVDFAEWLREYNAGLPSERRQHSSCGFYG